MEEFKRVLFCRVLTEYDALKDIRKSYDINNDVYESEYQFQMGRASGVWDIVEELGLVDEYREWKANHFHTDPSIGVGDLYWYDSPVQETHLCVVKNVYADYILFWDSISDEIRYADEDIIRSYYKKAFF